MNKPLKHNIVGAELPDDEFAEIVKGYLCPDESFEDEGDETANDDEVAPADETDLPDEWDDDAWDQEDPRDE